LKYRNLRFWVIERRKTKKLDNPNNTVPDKIPLLLEILVASELQKPQVSEIKSRRKKPKNWVPAKIPLLVGIWRTKANSSERRRP
jgi:hypothetical protein